LGPVGDNFYIKKKGVIFAGPISGGKGGTRCPLRHLNGKKGEGRGRILREW